MLARERLGHGGRRVQVDGEARIGSLVPQEHTRPGADRTVRDTVGAQFGPGTGGQRVAEFAQAGPGGGVERCLDGLFAHGGGVGQPDAVGGQHTGQRGYEDGVDAEGVGDGADVLAGRRRRSR